MHFLAFFVLLLLFYTNANDHVAVVKDGWPHAVSVIAEKPNGSAAPVADIPRATAKKVKIYGTCIAFM